MKAGILLLIVKDVIALLQTSGIITATGEFDETKLDTLQEDAAFAAAVTAILETRGVDVPDKLEKVIQLLPLLAGLVR